MDALQHEACNHNHPAVVEALLKAGANVNSPGYMHETPLHDAINNDRVEVALLLLKACSSPSLHHPFP